MDPVDEPPTESPESEPRRECFRGVSDRDLAFSIYEKNYSVAFKVLCNNFAIFWRARSRLYRSRLLQPNMRLEACFKFYKICTLLNNRSKINMFAKKRFEKSANFVKILNSAKVCKFCFNTSN